MSPDRLSLRSHVSEPRSAQPLELRLPSVPENVTLARHEAARYLEPLGVGSFEVEVAVTEAVANAIEHGYRGIAKGTITVRMELLVPDALAVSVEDDGVGMSPDVRGEHLGLGLSLIGRFSTDFDVVSRQPHGTAVRMRFDLSELG
jgi:anti-sigma regulatory factor (Ser/Thr protein kinase)